MINTTTKSTKTSPAVLTSNRRPVLGKRIQKKIMGLYSTGINMTGIQRLISQKNDAVTYYDVWKTIHTPQLTN